MGVEHYIERLDASTILAALLDEFSAVTDHRTLRDTLPRRLASLFKCRCVLLYQRVDEALHFVSGSFADQLGWSAALLAVAHINPIELSSELPEAQSWRARRAILASLTQLENAMICAPLLYRQRAIGVLVAIRAMPDLPPSDQNECLSWTLEDLPLVAVTANIVAMLLENARLLERDRERIHELSLLNGITSQMNCSLRERERVARIAIQRAREISGADLCEVLWPDAPDAVSNWLPLELQKRLFHYWQNDLHHPPLVMERLGEVQDGGYFNYLSPRIKTFFALPLLSNRDGKRVRGSLAPSLPRNAEEPDTSVLGIIIGAYYKPWKLRREELVLLQVLDNQASAALENIALMEDVLEARNEARRLLHQALDDQRLKELILESIPSGLITLDMQGQITTFNRAAGSVLGYHPVEVIGQPILKIMKPRSLEQALQSGHPQHETLLVSKQQGQEVALDLTLAPLLNDRGQQVGMLATFADITAMHHLEEEKRRLDRLASLGEMSASVAHEVRNPLASIKTSMQMVLDDLESSATQPVHEDIHEAVTVVLQEVKRLDSIVRDLLLFARPRQVHRVECQLSDLCGRLLHFLQPQCVERGVRVHQIYQALPPVQVDEFQMEQVLLNLFWNALQAMPDGGILSVAGQLLSLPAPVSSTRIGRVVVMPLDETAEEEETAGTQSILTEKRTEFVPQETWVEITVSDTGEGIAQENLERIFQPFHTTRAHGIGLGLPITRRLVEDHHGYILVESQLGYGTTFSVRLPLTLAEKSQSEVEGRTKPGEFDYFNH